MTIQVFTLISCFFFTPDVQLQIALDLSRQKHYEASERVLTNVDRRKLHNPDLYSYLRLLNNFSLNNKAEAEKYSKQLSDYLNTSLPIRYQHLSYLMINDMKTWKENDLNSISRDMKRIEDRLAAHRGGLETQKIQQEVVSKLDVMIKKMEEQKEKESQNASNQANQNKQKNENPKDRGEPQKDSEIANNVGPGQIDHKKLKELSQQWGNLPPKDRESNMRAITKDLPPRYRETIMEYFKKQSR